MRLSTGSGKPTSKPSATPAHLLEGLPRRVRVGVAGRALESKDGTGYDLLVGGLENALVVGLWWL